MRATIGIALVLALALVTAGAASAAAPLPRPKPPATTVPVPLPKPTREAVLPLPQLTPKEWPEKAVRAARAECRALLAQLDVTYEPLEPLGAPKDCGTPRPLRVSKVADIEIVPPARLNCAMTAALHQWLTDSVQPAAREAFDEAVAAVRNVASYDCRRRNNAAEGKFSEHAFANALDIAAFRLDSGETVTVADGRPAFIAAVNDGACEAFYTVLGPRSNALHQDHFHLDLARGGRYLICE